MFFIDEYNSSNRTYRGESLKWYKTMFVSKFYAHFAILIWYCILNMNGNNEIRVWIVHVAVTFLQLGKST